MRLILLRHAKSSWKEPFDSDHGRPLNKRGRKDAPRVGAYLKAAGWIPDVVISSDSARTRETWLRMAPVLAPEAPVRFTRQLYHGGLESIRHAVAMEQSDAECILAIGHNPGWEHAASTLTDQFLEMTTCNAALLISTETHWQKALASEGSWQLRELLRPRDF